MDPFQSKNVDSRNLRETRLTGTLFRSAKYCKIVKSDVFYQMYDSRRFFVF